MFHAAKHYMTYTLSVVNSGTGPGTATLSDTIRAGLSYVAGSAQLQGTGVLTAPAAGTGGVLQWSGALAAGARVTITFQATATTASGFLDNAAVISNTALSAPVWIAARVGPMFTSLNQDFEAGVLPAYWEQEDEGVGSADWEFVQANGTFYVNKDHTLGTSAGHIALVNDSYSNVTPPTNLLSPWILPNAGVEPALTLYHAGGSYGSGYVLHLDVITRAGEVTDALVITGSGYNEWHQAVLDLYAYRAAPFRLRFRGQTTTGWEQGLSMDDVSIDQAAPVWDGSFKTAAPAGLAVSGEPLTYSLVIANSGYGSGVITVTDNIPAGTSYRAGSAQTIPPNYGTLTANAGGIMWTGTVTRLSSITVTFAVDVTGGGVITNTAVLTAPTLSASRVITTVNRPPAAGLDEDFEHGGALPPGWFQDATDGGDNWLLGTRDNFGAPSDHTTGSGYLAYVYDYATDASPVNLLAPFVDLRLFTHPVLEFYLWQTQGNTPSAHFSTLHVDLYDGLTWVTDVYTSAAAHIPWTRVKVDLLAYRARPRQIRFRVTDAAGLTGTRYADVDIDDVRIQEAAPTFDLSTKTVFPDHGQTGRPLTYTVVIANDDFMAGDVTFTDPLPAGTSYDGYAQVTPAGGTLDTSSGIRWTGPVAARSAVTLTYRVNVSAAAGTEIVNTATITAPQASETVTRSARVRVIEPAIGFCASFESGWPTSMFTSTTSTYNNTGRAYLETGYAHTGDYAALLRPLNDAAYVYQSAILAGNLQRQANVALTFWLRGLGTNIPAANGLYASADNGLTYTKIYTFPTGTFAYQPIALDLDALLVAAGIPLSDNVLLKFQVYESYSAYGYALDDVCLRGPAPDYSASFKRAPGVAGVGQALTYTVVLRNGGDLDGAPVFTDTLPSAWPYVAGSAQASSGPAPVYSGGKITWSGTVTAGQSVTLTYAVSVANATQVTNTAVLRDAAALHSDLAFQASTRAYPAAALGTCVDFETGLLPTTMFTETTTNVYTAGRVRIVGDQKLDGAYSLHLDSYPCYGSSSYSTRQAAVLVANLGGVTQAQLTFWLYRYDTTITADDGIFISGDGGNTYTRIVNPSAYNGLSKVSLDLDALARASGIALGDGFLIFQGYGNRPLTTQGYVYDNICLRAPVPMYDTSTKTASQDILRAGTPLTYTIRITNTGEITGGAALSDSIPAGATYIPGSATASSGVITPTASSIEWSGTLPQGQSVTVRFAVTPTVGGYLTNTAVISDPVAAAPVTVTRRVWVYAPASLPYSEGFESGLLPTHAYTEGTRISANDWGRAWVSPRYPHSGAYALDLNREGYSGYPTTQAFVLAVDLSGQTNVYLDFWLRAPDDSRDSADGIFISNNNGQSYTKIFAYPSGKFGHGSESQGVSFTLAFSDNRHNLLPIPQGKLL